ncbi:putative drebrin family b, partial [Neoconidiobolus thromboides FSU 785]
MSISLNLSTHSKDLKSAYQTVIDKSSDTDWALFEYEKGTNDLKVSGTGDGGLEEISEEFEDDKVLYAFVRVMDPNTNLPKFIFISWCGESAPVRRKGLLAAHLSDVQSFLKGYHIQINARDQSDVEPAQIMKKIDEGSGAKY